MIAPIPLYFISGAMCDDRLWLPVIEALEKYSPHKYQCEILPIPQTHSFSDAVLALSQILHAKSKQMPCYLIGFSLGGYLAASLAAKNTQHIKKLLLVSSMPSVLPSALMKKRGRVIAFLKKHGYQGASLERTKVLVDKIHRNNHELLTLVQAMDHQSGGDTLIQQLSLTMQRENVLEPLHQSQLPVLFSVGESDCKVDLDEMFALLADYNQMEVRVTENTGHMFPLESPKVLAQQIQEWCA